MESEKVKILMVCLGNICRSPTAEAVFMAKARLENLDRYIEVDSAGTGSWHIGHAPDKRATLAASHRNYDMSALRARQVTAQDIERFDYIYAMDKQNLHDLLAMSTPDQQHKISLFLEHGNSNEVEVPDPYYSGDEGFELVLDLIEDASSNLLKSLATDHQWS